MIQKHIYITIKGTLRCNLACQYCYGRDNKHLGGQMTAEEMHMALLFCRDYVKESGAKALTLCWHGGEPLLMYSQLPSLMKEANKMFAEIGVQVTHGMQTNAISLIPETFDMIKTYLNGHIGVSLDLFSRYRTFPDGSPSTQIAISNIDRALNAGISCGSINLITQDNRKHIPDIYTFYKQRNMNVRLARVFPIRDEDICSNPMYLSDEEFAYAMIEYFNIWVADPKPAYNRDIVSLVGDLMLGKPSLCFREKECHNRYLALSPGGDVFTCAEFDVPESVVGNFLTQSAKEFIQSDLRDKLSHKAPIPEKCHECKYEKICSGGCFRERFMLGYPYRCKSNYLYWNHIEDWLKSKGSHLYILEGKSAEEGKSILHRVFGKDRLV